MHRLIDIVQEMSLARTIDRVTEIVRHAARELANADGATFVLRDGEHCFYKDEEAIAPLWKGKRFPIADCVSGWSMLNRRPAVIPNIADDPRVPYEAYRPTFVKSMVMVPIRTLDPIGAIGVYWARHYQADAYQVQVLQALADSTSIALENVQVYAELESRIEKRTQELAAANRHLVSEIEERQRVEAAMRELSLTDDLTGIYNRRGFKLLADRALEAARRRGVYCHLIYLDLDGLKSLNDAEGHAAGDMLLREATGLLQNVFRRTDIVARLGGDEFAVLAVDSNTSADDIRRRLATALSNHQRIGAQRLQGSHLGLGDTRAPRLSFSVGHVDVAPEQTDSLEALLALADSRMYAQKVARRQAPPVVLATHH
ncbi:GGDEF domain-containing protein [Dongia rigui]|uniref:diguanylate cyclase n=1 Tax=Dongia rigui TaxID=940149 RepID=A0ABU5E0K3_9PROT|nr:diguanylate cyclase [Dongia rigui]MDY0872341.1 diguanylate cyclase [Dongia rigui]